MSTWDDLKASAPQDNQGRIEVMSSDVVNNLAPMATVYSKGDNLGKFQQQNIKVAPQDNSVVGQALEFAGNFAGQIGGLIGEGAKFLVDTTVRSIEAPFKFAGDVASAPFKQAEMSAKLDNITREMDSLNNQTTSLSQSYRDGRITKEAYQKELLNITKQIEEKRKQITDVQNQVKTEVEGVTQHAIDTGLDVIAVFNATSKLTTTAVAGDGSVPNLVNFFGKHEVSDKVFKGAQVLDKITNFPLNTLNKAATLGGKLPDNAIFKILEETAANSATLGGKEIAKKTAINIILKKPIIYQTNFDQIKDVYLKSLDGDLSGASLSLMATTAMTLSSGPIGLALEKAGKFGNWLKNAAYSGGDIAKIMEADNLKEAGKFTQELIEAQRGNMLSRQSFIDSLSVHFGSGKANQVYDYLQAELAKGNTTPYKMMKVMEEINMKMAGGDAVKAAQLAIDWHNGLDGGRFLKGASAQEFVEGMIKHPVAREIAVKDAIAHGMSKMDAERIVVGRVARSDLATIADYVRKADEAVGKIDFDNADDFKRIVDLRIQHFRQAVDRYGKDSVWANSTTFKGQVEHILQTAHSTDSMLKSITSIKASKMYEGISTEAKYQLQKLGYMAVLPERATFTPYVEFDNLTNKTLKTSFVKGDAGKGITAVANVFEKAVAPVPVLREFTGLLSKLGMSPEASGNLTHDYFKANFSDNIAQALKAKGIGVSSGAIGLGGEEISSTGDDILARLYSYIKEANNSIGHNVPISDLRQFSKKQIKAALQCNDEQAKMVMRAINTSMLNIPLSIRGVGDKVQDAMIAMTGGTGGGFARYQKYQGAYRYGYNPFFKLQQAGEAEGLVQLEAAAQGLGLKKVQFPGLTQVNRILFGEETSKLDDVVSQLEAKHIFPSGFTGQGEAASAAAAMQGVIRSHITKSEKMSLAGLIELQARRAGYDDIGKFIDENHGTITDTLQAITGHSHGTDFLDSPLARTLNVAFFPMRYNLKISGVIAQNIAKFPATTQVALIAGFLNASDWLKSDQGIAWQSQYADAIKLFQWLSPTYTLGYVIQLGKDALGDPDASISDLGTLGGLPFGMITQFLQSAGYMQTPPYVDPKSGYVYPKYVPDTAKANVNLAIQSFLGSLFTYPGSVIGLPSKGSMLRNTTGWLLGKDGFTEVDQNQFLSPQQKHEQEIIMQANAERTGVPLQSAANQTAQPVPEMTTVPAGPLPLANLPKKPVLKTATTRKKKSDYKPRPI